MAIGVFFAARMRVLHVISGIDPENGGPSIALHGLAVAQRRMGIDVTVTATFQRASVVSVAEQWREAGLRVELIGPASGALSRHADIAPRLAQLVREADVVHIHALWEEIQHQAARAAEREGVPYLVRPCGLLYPRSLAKGWLKKKLYVALRLRRTLDRAAAIHFTTDDERHGAAIPIKARAIVEPNGLDLGEFDPLPPPGSFSRLHPQLAGRRFVLFLGRVHPEKGLELLIPAMAKLDHKDVALVVAGPDNAGALPRFGRLAEQEGVRDRVLFVGMLDRPTRVAALRDAALLSLPSFHENFGISVIEALAAGTPVVVSDHVGLHHLIAQERLGGVVPLDAAALASALDRWLGDEPLRASAADRGRAVVSERFDWNRVAARWAEHYAALTGNAAAHAARARTPRLENA
jgi:glycosyltransferase involved in cell wall biosynthesis